MANFTQRAIKESFLKLLNEKPLNKISVKDIVEDCGINRNSFYYHFQDIPALLEEMVLDEGEKLISEYPEIESLDKCVEVATLFAIQNKVAVLHIYNSVNRDLLERYLKRVCNHVVTRYLETAFAGHDVPKEDKDIAVHMISCCCFGLIIDWLDTGLNEESPKHVKRICELCRGIPDEIISKVSKN